MNMTDAPDPEEAIAICPVIHWRGTVWRAHKRRYPALDPTGSSLITGRYNRAPDRYPDNASWLALYLALGPEVCLGEILRNTTQELMPGLNTYRISEIDVELDTIIDCRNIAALGISLDDLMNDHDYTLSQRLGAAALAMGVEGLLVPSATRLGDNLVVFPTQLRPKSRLEVVGSRDPVLYVERS